MVKSVITLQQSEGDQSVHTAGFNILHLDPGMDMDYRRFAEVMVVNGAKQPIEFHRSTVPAWEVGRAGLKSIDRLFTALYFLISLFDR